MLICTRVLDSNSFSRDFSLIQVVDKQKKLRKCLKGLAVPFCYSAALFDGTLNGGLSSGILTDHSNRLKSFFRKLGGFVLFFSGTE